MKKYIYVFDNKLIFKFIYYALIYQF